MLLRVAALVGSLLLLFGSNAVADEPPSTDGAEANAADPGFDESMLEPQDIAAQRLFTPEPTGDALWDRYVQALLAAFGGGMSWASPWPESESRTEADIEKAYAEAEDDAGRDEALMMGLQPENPPRLPDRLLASWEPQFGKDPRYWQLRYWNAWQYNDKLEQGDADPERFLREGKSKGVTDAATDWLLVRGSLNQLQRAENAEELETNYRAQLELLDDFISNYPEGSVGWYKRALLRADYGSFTNCVDDLKAGNAAPQNRELDVFPYSFVARCLAERGQPGSEAVAGVVILCDSMREHEDLGRGANEFFKNAQVVLSIDGDTALLPPLFSYAVRVSMRKDASEAVRLTGINGIRMLATTLLVEGDPDRGQKAALLKLRDRAINAGRKLSSPLINESPAPNFTWEYLPQHLGKELTNLGFTYDDLAMAVVTPPYQTPKDWEYGAYMGNWPEMNLGWTMWPFEASWARGIAPLARYKVTYDWALARRGPESLKQFADLELISKFDIEALSWPADDPDAGA